MLQLGFDACLADDMGMGKTIQVIDLILRLKAADRTRAEGVGQPCLLLVLAGTPVENQRARKVVQSENAPDAILASIAQYFAAKSAGPSLPSAAPVRARGRKRSSK